MNVYVYNQNYCQKLFIENSNVHQYKKLEVIVYNNQNKINHLSIYKFQVKENNHRILLKVKYLKEIKKFVKEK